MLRSSKTLPGSAAALGLIDRVLWAAAVCLAALMAAPVGSVRAAALPLNPGDILVADGGSLTSGGGVFRVDPASGAQTAVVFGGRYLFREGVAVEHDRDILVADAFGEGGPLRVDRVDPATGAETVLSVGVSGQLAVEADGDILVASPPRPREQQPAGVTRLDPVTGAQTTVSAGGSFRSPAAIALEADGDILIADPGDFFDPGPPDAVIRVDPVSGAQSTVTSGGLLVSPHGVAVEADGDILVGDSDAFGGAGGVIRIDPTTGAQTTVSAGGSFVDPHGIAVEADGDILVADRSAFRIPYPVDRGGAVFRIDPLTGAQTTVSSGDMFAGPRAIAVVAQTNEPPDCSAVTAGPSTLRYTGGRQLTTITLSGATDPDGDALSFHIDSVQQDEPVSGTAGKNTFPDAQLVGATADSNQVRVRAERDPRGNGRVYRIAYTVSDGAANCSGLAKLLVLRNKPRGAVDDGDTRRWDSFTGAGVFP